MRERRIYDVKVRHAENEFVHADAWQPICFSDQPIVGRTFEFGKIIKIAAASGQTRQHTHIARANTASESDDACRRGEALWWRAALTGRRAARRATAGRASWRVDHREACKREEFPR